MVKVPIMEVINMTRMFDRSVAATSAMLMAVVGVGFRGAHRIFLGGPFEIRRMQRIRSQPVNFRPEPRLSTTMLFWPETNIFERVTLFDSHSSERAQRGKAATKSSSKRVVVLLPRVVAQRHSRGAALARVSSALANLFHHEPGPHVRQQAAPGNVPGAGSSTGWI
jgi:hypothetical protein